MLNRCMILITLIASPLCAMDQKTRSEGKKEADSQSIAPAQQPARQAVAKDGVSAQMQAVAQRPQAQVRTVAYPIDFNNPIMKPTSGLFLQIHNKIVSRYGEEASQGTWWVEIRDNRWCAAKGRKPDWKNPYSYQNSMEGEL